jgi:hypothetical protein
MHKCKGECFAFNICCYKNYIYADKCPCSECIIKARCKTIYLDRCTNKTMFNNFLNKVKEIDERYELLIQYTKTRVGSND